MVRSKQPVAPTEEALEELLDMVANAREELVSIERRLENLSSAIAKSETKSSNSTKKAR
jgi:uncharacterized coiled-coil protein SlyX